MSRYGAQPRLIRRRGRRVWYIAHGDDAASTGTESRDEAQRALDAYLDRLARPLNPTVAQLLDARLADAESRGVVRLDNLRWQHRWLRQYMGHLRPEEITQPALQRYREARAHAPTALRRELEELRATLRLHRLPYDHVGLPPNRMPRDKWLSREEAKRLLAACGTPHLRLWCLIALTTGRRKGAILDLTWDRVDLERRTIDFDVPGRVETRKRRGAISIPRRLVAALADAREVAVTPHVIEYRARRLKDIERGFAQAVEDAGLPLWVTPHVLKHTAISWLAERWSPAQIADYTATHLETVMRVYRKVNGEQLAEMGEDLATGLFEGPAKWRAKADRNAK